MPENRPRRPGAMRAVTETGHERREILEVVRSEAPCTDHRTTLEVPRR